MENNEKTTTVEEIKEEMKTEKKPSRKKIIAIVSGALAVAGAAAVAIIKGRHSEDVPTDDTAVDLGETINPAE